MKKSKKRLQTNLKRLGFIIEPPFICKICGKEVKSTPGLSSHIKNQHDGYSYYDYVQDFYHFDIEKENEKWEKGREERAKIGHDKTSKNNKKLHLSHKDRLGEENFKKFKEKMKGVFTLDWYIDKYGELEGNRLYKERVENISKTSYFRKYNKENKQNWSKISQELFWKIYEKIKNDYIRIYFGELNNEFSCGTKNNFDFVVVDNKKVIEFNGDAFHCNPKIYKEDDKPLYFIEESAKEIWKKDEEKINRIKLKGYDVLVVWESDYKKDKNSVVEKCINFINGE